MVSFYVTGEICNMEALGWRYSFYIFAVVAFIWFIPYHFLIYSRPENDPHLSDYERDLIKQERKAEIFDDISLNGNVIKVPPKLSFKILLTSRAVWASW